MKGFITPIKLEKGIIETYSEEEYIQLVASVSHALMTIQNIFNPECKLNMSLESQ